MKRGIAIRVAALLLVCVFSFGYVAWFLTRPKPAGVQDRPNILVLSFCSFRIQMLSHYAGHDMGWVPAFDKFFANSSYVFENAFNGLEWEGVFSFTRPLIPHDLFTKLGYHLLGTVEAGHLLRIPYRQSRIDGYFDPDVNDNDFEKNHQADTDYLPSAVSSQMAKPFFLIAHYKYLHYPLIDYFNADSQWDYYLTPAERRLISEYLNHPEKYPEKMPLLMMLSDDPRVVLANPEVKARHWKDTPRSRIELMGLLTNPHFLKEWKDSPGYKDDLALLEKVYRGTARYLDKVVAPELNLWGNENLRRNTVLIVMSDHGEMHMERGHLTHGDSLYDEGLKVPVAIRFPGASGSPVSIKDQVDFSTIAKMIEGIMKGEITKDNLASMIPKLSDGVVMARDCQNDQRGLRYKNKWKYFVRIADGQRFLYDLQKDPGETVNVADTHPDIADKMESLYWDHYPQFSRLDYYHCAPWNGADAR